MVSVSVVGSSILPVTQKAEPPGVKLEFLHWFTIAFGILFFIVVLAYVFGWARPRSPDHMSQVITGLFGILGMLVGVLVQEFRVNNIQQEATEARQLAEGYRRNIVGARDFLMDAITIPGAYALPTDSVTLPTATVDSLLGKLQGPGQFMEIRQK